jgi:hypothetical protein
MPEWIPNSPITNFELDWYTDIVSNFNKQKENATTNDQVFNITTEKDHPIVKLAFNDMDAKPNTLKIEAIGVRGQIQEPVSGSITTAEQESDTIARLVANQLTQPYTQRYSNGTPSIIILCRRTATINSLNIGDWTLVDIDMMPNQATHLRGGNRIMQVVGKSFDGVKVRLTLIDGAINSTMAVPTINSVVANATLANNAVNVSITTTENARVLVQYAVTPSGGSQPSSGDAGWIHGTIGVINNTTQTLYVDSLPSGIKVWIRARAESVATADVKMPSAWVYSTGTILGSLSAPSNLVISNISTKSAKLTWIPTERTKTEVRLASPPASSMNSVVLLPSGSTTYTLRGLDLLASPSCSVGIRHVDNVLGRSTIISGSFVAIGSPDQLPDLGEIIVYYGDTV